MPTTLASTLLLHRTVHDYRGEMLGCSCGANDAWTEVQHKTHLADVATAWFAANKEEQVSVEAEWTYERIAARADIDPAFRSGLIAAAAVCRAQGTDPSLPACPPGMAAVYLDRLANGETP